MEKMTDFYNETAHQFFNYLDSLQNTKPFFDMPYNPHTSKRFTGLNALFLSMSGYQDPRFFTYNQLKEMTKNTGYIKKGAKGLKLLRPIRVKQTTSEQQDDSETTQQLELGILTENTEFNNISEESEQNKDSQKENYKIFFQSYTVFNADQCVGVLPAPQVTNSVKSLIHMQTIESLYDKYQLAFPQNIQGEIEKDLLKLFSHWAKHIMECDSPEGSTKYNLQLCVTQIFACRLLFEMLIPFETLDTWQKVKDWAQEKTKENPKEIIKILTYAMDICTQAKEIALDLTTSTNLLAQDELAYFNPTHAQTDIDEIAEDMDDNVVVSHTPPLLQPDSEIRNAITHGDENEEEIISTNYDFG